MLEDRLDGWPGPPVEAPSLESIDEAAWQIREVVVRTPLLPLLGNPDDGAIHLKVETLQPIGSFKLRGVANWALSLTEEEAARGLSTISAGNTAIAVGYMARRLGVPSRAIVPPDLHAWKRGMIEANGTTIVEKPLGDLITYMFEERWREDDLNFLNPWGEPAMITGHGAMGLEITDDLPKVESVFVPVGGGGLIAGVGAVLRALRPAVKVYAVQAEACAPLVRAFAIGGPTWIEMGDTIMEGAAVPVITRNMYPLLRSLVDEVVTVSEDEVKAAIRRLAVDNKLVTEGAGAASVAAALKVGPRERGTAVCVVSGASIKPALLAEVLADT